MYTPPAHKIQLDTFDPLYIAQNLNAGAAVGGITCNTGFAILVVY